MSSCRSYRSAYTTPYTVRSQIFSMNIFVCWCYYYFHHVCAFFFLSFFINRKKGKWKKKKQNDGRGDYISILKFTREHMHIHDDYISSYPPNQLFAFKRYRMRYAKKKNSTHTTHKVDAVLVTKLILVFRTFGRSKIQFTFIEIIFAWTYFHQRTQYRDFRNFK